MLVIAEVALGDAASWRRPDRARISFPAADEPGVPDDRLLMVGATSGESVCHLGEARRVYTKSMERALRRSRGVEVARSEMASSATVPRYRIEGGGADAPDPIVAGLISADYQRAMGILLAGGRALTAQEVAARGAGCIDQPGSGSCGMQVRVPLAGGSIWRRFAQPQGLFSRRRPPAPM